MAGRVEGPGPLNALAAGCAEWMRLQYSRIDRLQGHHVQFAGDSTSTVPYDFYCNGHLSPK